MSAHLVKLDSPPDLVDQVYRALLGAICDGSLPPGGRITQEDIAARLAVSRQPVLQALRLLKNDGFVHDAPGRGVQVAPLDVALVQQVYQVRGALDVLAARLAAAQRTALDPALLTRGRKAAAGKNIQAMIDADLQFHEAIYRAAGNPLIAAAAAPQWRHLRRVMGAVLQSSSQRATVWDEHQAIADAMATGQGAQAARLIAQHSEQASAHLSQRLSERLSEQQPSVQLGAVPHPAAPDVRLLATQQAAPHATPHARRAAKKPARFSAHHPAAKRKTAGAPR